MPDVGWCLDIFDNQRNRIRQANMLKVIREHQRKLNEFLQGAFHKVAYFVVICS